MKLDIIDRLVAIFNPQFRAVYRNPFNIVLFDNPSERLQKAAVKLNSQVFMVLKNPSESIAETVVKENPSYIRFISQPSERLQLQAISQDPSVISSIRKPSMKTQLTAVSYSRDCIHLINNPCVDAIKLYIGNDYSRLWNINMSKENHERVFNDIFRSGKDSWNISDKEFIFWLSNYTQNTEENVKAIYNEIKESSINTDRISVKQWDELFSTGKFVLGKKEVVLTEKDRILKINNIEKAGHAAVSVESDLSIKNEDNLSSVPKATVKKDDIKTETEKVTDPKLDYLRECLKNTKKKIKESDFLAGLKENNLSLNDLSNDQIGSLIRTAQTSLENKNIRLIKGVSGYKIKTEERIEDVKLEETGELKKDLKLSEKQMQDLEKKGFTKISDKQIVKRIPTQIGYSFKIYNIVNTLTQKGQAEA